MIIFNYTCYRNYLADRFKAMKAEDPKRSLRQQALSLDISYTRLWEVCQGKGHFRSGTIQKLAYGLGLKDEESHYLLNLHKKACSKDKDSSREAKSELSRLRYQHQYEALKLDDKRSQQWYHYTILFLASKEPHIKIETLAQRLSLSSDLIEQAVFDLQRDSLLTIEDGKLVPFVGYFKVMDQAQSKAIRNFHSSMIHKSIHAMTQRPVNERYFCTHIFTLKKERYEKLINSIGKFIAEETGKDTAEDSKDVFCLSAQLFPLSLPTERL